MLELFESERVRFITNQISEMHRGKISLSELGNIALQTLMARREVEEILEGDNPKERKEVAQKELKHLKELEKGLVYLYINSLNVKRKNFDDISLQFYFLNDEV